MMCRWLTHILDGDTKCPDEVGAGLDFNNGIDDFIEVNMAIKITRCRGTHFPQDIFEFFGHALGDIHPTVFSRNIAAQINQANDGQTDPFIGETIAFCKMDITLSGS